MTRPAESGWGVSEGDHGIGSASAGPTPGRPVSADRAVEGARDLQDAGTGEDAGDERDLGPEADQEAVAREIVLRQLTVRARTRSELATTLARRQVPTEAAEAVLDRMAEVGLIDDAAFAEGWVRSRQQRRHLSSRALKQELRRKGVDAEIVTEALAEVEPDDEHIAALALVQKKARTMSGLEPAVRRRRLAGALARKGFGGSIVYQVLDEVEGTVDDAD